MRKTPNKNLMQLSRRNHMSIVQFMSKCCTVYIPPATENQALFQVISRIFPIDTY